MPKNLVVQKRMEFLLLIETLRCAQDDVKLGNENFDCTNRSKNVQELYQGS